MVTGAGAVMVARTVDGVVDGVFSASFVVRVVDGGDGVCACTSVKDDGGGDGVLAATAVEVDEDADGVSAVTVVAVEEVAEEGADELSTATMVEVEEGADGISTDTVVPVDERVDAVSTATEVPVERVDEISTGTVVPVDEGAEVPVEQGADAGSQLTVGRSAAKKGFSAGSAAAPRRKQVEMTCKMESLIIAVGERASEWMKVERREMEVKSKAMCLSMSFDDSEMPCVNLAISTKASWPISSTYPQAPGQLLGYVLSAFEVSSIPDGMNRLIDVELGRS